ncbi:caspase-9 isoform X2 [Malurus melanocephalus]|uniref:caspase-9 isoform X2 n=1 Tax=Malurus melanocephalus TaxID=175006 RepID=UPI002548EE01|nr:caspase-9 isoform X2 [Malurus melanocephalus]
MEEQQRRALRRGRARLVGALRVEPLWDPLEQRGLFTRPMLEELQSAGSRGDQARQLIIDLETRGKQAFPVFLSILRDTGQGDLAEMLLQECKTQPVPAQLPDLRPVELELREEKQHKNVTPPERLSIPVQAESERPRIPSVPAWGSAAAKRSRDMDYEMKADPCGHCLILNNVNFSRESDLSTREGSDIDCEKLERRFKALRFTVLVRRDLKAQEMVLELLKLSRQDHSALDCCIVVILSHGCQTSHIQFPGGVYGTDGKPIPVEKIVNYFNGSNCPSLRGKPKLFFIQACGGEQRDQGFVVDCDSPQDEAPGGPLESDATPFQAPPGNVDEPDAITCLPTPSDILVSYSTFPGFVSWREKSTGSWYVETLDSVLEQYARSEDLLNMLLRVANAVSAKGRYKQIPGCFNFLRKKFFFLCN